MVNNYNKILYENERIETERLLLRKFEMRDAPYILEYASDAETVKWLDWGGSKTLEEAIGNITDYYWSRPGIYAVELKETGCCIGGADLRIEPEHEKAGFGYVLNKKHWNKGYMSETLSALLRLCFDKLELNRVEAVHYVGNEASGRVMAKCGMEFEGVGKAERKIKGEFRDAAHYGITREQYNIIKPK